MINFTFGMWYMVVAEQVHIGLIILTCTLAALVAGGLIAYLAEDVMLIRTVAYKLILVTFICSGLLLAFMPRTTAHAAFMLQGQLAIAEAEGRPVPKFSPQQMSAVESLAAIYQKVELAGAAELLHDAEQKLDRKKN